VASFEVIAMDKYQCSLSPELLKKAEKELNEKGKWRDRDIQALRDMVLLHKGIHQHFLKTICTCDYGVQ